MGVDLLRKDSLVSNMGVASVGKDILEACADISVAPSILGKKITGGHRMKRRTKLVLATWLLLVGFMTLTAEPVDAVEGRDFAGYYELTNVVDQGNVVSMNFAARIFNYSETDVIGAELALEDPNLPDAYAIFPSVRIDYQGSVVVTSQVSIPGSEYDQWSQGGTPRLTITYFDARENVISRPIELVKMPLGGQQ